MGQEKPQVTTSWANTTS